MYLWTLIQTQSTKITLAFGLVESRIGLIEGRTGFVECNLGLFEDRIGLDESLFGPIKADLGHD